MEKKFEGNAALKWHTVRHPLRALFNMSVMLVLKYVPPMELKNQLYRTMLGMKIGKDVAITMDVMFDPMFPELIEIGDGCTLGWGSRVFTHEFWPDRLRVLPVRLGRKVFLGGFSVIRPGVNLADNVIIASNSFVNKPIEKEGVYGGVPAKPIRERL